jgi:hypothetical protein
MNTIQNKGKWNEISATLNDNFNLIAAELMKLGDAAYKAKGFFNTADDLVDAYPSSPDGSYAYVGSQAPYTLYKMNNGLWESTTQNVTIEEALDSIFDWSTIPSADEETRGLMTSAHVNLLNNIKELSETQEIEIDNIKKIIEEGVGGGGGSVTIVDASQITDAANDNKNLSEINTEMYDRLNDLEKIDPNGGLVRDYKGLKVKAGLGVRASSQGISVNAGKGLVTNIDDGYISVSAKEKGGIDVTSDGLSVSVGEGLSISEKNQVTVNLGTGLMLLEDNDIVLNISKGLTFSDKGALTISTSKGLSTNEDGSIGIALANNSGLEFEGDNIRINEDIVNLPSLLDEAIETLGAEDEAINKRIDSLESGSVNLKPQSNKIYDSVNGDTYNDATAESNVYVYKGAPQSSGSISNDVLADVNIQTYANVIDIVGKSWGTKDWNTRARLKPATSGAAGVMSADQCKKLESLQITSSVFYNKNQDKVIASESPIFVKTSLKVTDYFGYEKTLNGISMAVGSGLVVSTQSSYRDENDEHIAYPLKVYIEDSGPFSFDDIGKLCLNISTGLKLNSGSIMLNTSDDFDFDEETGEMFLNTDLGIGELKQTINNAQFPLTTAADGILKLKYGKGLSVDANNGKLYNTLQPQQNKDYSSSTPINNDVTSSDEKYVYKGAPQSYGSISNDVLADVNIQTYANAIDIVGKSWGTKDWNTRARLKPASAGAAGLISAEQFSNIIFKSKLGNAMTFDSATDTVTLKISSSIQFVSYTPPTIQDSPLFVATKWKVNDTDQDDMSASGLGFLFGRGLFLDKSDQGTGTGELNAYPLSVKLGKGLSFSGGDNINVEVGTGLQILDNNEIVVHTANGLIVTKDGIAIDTKITDDIKYNLDLIGELEYKYSELEGTVGELENRKLETEGKSIVITDEGKIKLKFSGTKGLAEDDYGLKVAVDDNYFKFNDKGLIQISTDLGLSDSIQTVNDRITDVEDGAEASIGDLSKRLDDIETYGSRLDTLEGSVSGFTNQISSLQTADTRIDGVLTEHGKSIASNTTSITSLRTSKQNKLNTGDGISISHQDVISVKIGSGLFLDNDGNLSATVDARVEENATEIADIKKGLDAHTQSITGLLTQNRNITTSISTLNTNLTELQSTVTTNKEASDTSIASINKTLEEVVGKNKAQDGTIKTNTDSITTLSSTQTTQGQNITQLMNTVNNVSFPLSTATDGVLKLKYGGSLGKTDVGTLVVKISTKKGVFEDADGLHIGIDGEYFKFAESGELQMSTDFNSASLYSQLTSVKSDVSSVKSDVSSLKNNQLGYDGSSLNKSSDNKLYVQENGLIDNGVVGLNLCLGTTMIRNSSAWSYSDDNLSSPLYVSTHARNNPNGSASGLGIAIGGSIKLGTSETFKGQTVSPIEVKTGEGLTYNSNGAVSVHVGQTFRKVGYSENDEGETELDVQVYGSASPFIVSSVENRETINGTIVNGFGIALGEGLGIDRSDHIYINDKEVGFLTIAVGAGLKLEDGRLKIDENYIKSLING